MLEVQGLTKAFPGGPCVVRDVDFRLAEDETLVVVGPSGCGKTTLLYMLCGLARPDAGKVLLDGQEITGPTRNISIILQDYGLLPWRSVLDNVGLGLKLRGSPKKERRKLALDQLAQLGLAGREKDYPTKLSGGEQQRVAIARAFVTGPRLMLLDEPFSSLDALTREKLQATLLDVWRSRKIPFVLVTHSLEEAAFLGKRIIVMGHRPARALACFDNPGFGRTGWRQSGEFFELVTSLRTTLEARS